MKPQVAYAIVNNKGVVCNDFRVPVFWYKSMAEAACPEGRRVEKVMVTRVADSKEGQYD